MIVCKDFVLPEKIHTSYVATFIGSVKSSSAGLLRRHGLATQSEVSVT